MKNYQHIATLLLRITLGITLLSAVADRFGLWGVYGAKNVAWGDWEHFVAYTHQLNFFVPLEVAEVLAILATTLEIIFGLALILGFFTRLAALGTSILTGLFALTMTLALGIKTPLDFSVFVFSAAAFLMASINQYRWSLDTFFGNKRDFASNKQNPIVYFHKCLPTEKAWHQGGL